MFGAAVAIDRAQRELRARAWRGACSRGRARGSRGDVAGHLLERAENDGAVNLTMAHVMVREKSDQEAKAYFHRAIFGRWGADSLTGERRLGSS